MTGGGTTYIRTTPASPTATGPLGAPAPAGFRDLAAGALLGLAGFGLHRLGLSAMAGSAPLSLGLAAPLAALVWLGPRPAAVAAVLSAGAGFAEGGALEAFSRVLEALAIGGGWLAWRSMLFSTAVYWASAGWLLGLPLERLADGAAPADEIFASRAVSALLAATLVEAVALLHARDGEQAALARALAGVTPPLLLLSLVALALLGPRRDAAIPLPALVAGALVAATLLAGIAVLRLRGASASLPAPAPPPAAPASFESELARAIASGGGLKRPFAVLHADLDRFRNVDAALGREAADRVLAGIAGRLEAIVGPGGCVARLGGDEFGLLLPGVGQLEEAASRALGLMEAVKRPFNVDGKDVVVTATVGFSLYPKDGTDPRRLLDNATAAAYAAKERGEDSFHRFTARLRVRDAQRAELGSGLRRAIEREELALQYQPIVCLASGRVEKVEALVRWLRPGGAVPPADFIPFSEASGLITSLDAWVMRTACAEIANLGCDVQPGVAVNLSTRQLQQTDLLDQVAQALGDSGLAPERLAIEITEGVAMQDVERTIGVLRQLRGLGVSVSIDDFGTGYSSLSYLRRLPVDVVKLDQSFVRDMTTSADGAAVARAVLALSKSLKLKVVAEGVETEEQLAFLRREGCDYVQGNLFSRPLFPADLRKLLAETGGVLRPEPRPA
ncbi:MAG: putative bifunctional diguanylate cyclase/phosphodiesterase [Vicinamibacteria bacterium]